MGEWMKDVRQTAGLSVEQLVERIEANTEGQVSTHSIYAWEGGRRLPLQKLPLWAAGVGLDLNGATYATGRQLLRDAVANRTAA